MKPLININKIFKFLFLLTLAFPVGGSTAYAVLYGQSVEFNDLLDRRTFETNNYGPPNSEGGLKGYWPGFTIEWNISQNLATGIWTYEYTLVNSRDISHMILELSHTSQAGDITNVIINGSPGDFEGPQDWSQSGNITLPNPIYGVKFDVGGNPVIYSFETTLDPVWGNFFA